MTESKEKYIERQFKKAVKYAKDVEEGNIVVNQYIKQAVKRQREFEKKYYFSKEAVERVYGFMYFVNLTQKGKVKRLELIPWQAWTMYNMFGFFKDKEFKHRLTREAIIYLSRKASKTTTASLLAIYALLKEERNQEAYTLSLTREQASQSLRYAKQIIRDSPALRKRVDVLQHKLRTKVNGSGVFRALPARADALLGLSPGMIIVDEYSVFPSKEEVNALTTGILARENPMVIYTTTASFYKDYPFYSEDLETGKKVLRGEAELDSVFYALYTLDSADEEHEPEMWIKANPSIGYTITQSGLEALYEKAQLSASDRLEFLTKNLNLFVDSADQWIPDEAYKKCFVDVDEDVIAGQPAYIGLDMSATRDLASLVLVVEGKDNKLHIIPEFYFPTSDNESNKIRKSGIDLTRWIESGWILPHDKAIIDYDEVFERIKYFSENFALQGIFYDPYNAQQLKQRVDTELLVDTFPFKQNTLAFNAPLKFLERVIYSEQVTLSKSPVLRWNFRNVVLYRDGNNNIKIIKNKSKDSVDGAVAAAMAIGGYLKFNFDNYDELLDNMFTLDKED